MAILLIAALAVGYLRESLPASDDELLAAVARGECEGDLEVHFWKDQKDLEMRVRGRMKDLLPLAKDDDYEGFNASLGVRTEEWQKAERLADTHRPTLGRFWHERPEPQHPGHLQARANLPGQALEATTVRRRTNCVDGQSHTSREPSEANQCR
jgi:hypothetical protein